jgi:hypothetical protein
MVRAVPTSLGGRSSTTPQKKCLCGSRRLAGTVAGPLPIAPPTICECGSHRLASALSPPMVERAVPCPPPGDR